MAKLSECSYDADAIKKEYMRQKCNAAVKKLAQNNFDAHYCDTKAEAGALLLSLIPDDATIGCGDSHTLFALDLDDRLKEKNCVAIPHLCALNKHSQMSDDYGYVKLGSPEEMRDVLRQYLVADIFLLGANAITMDGQIINVDGVGNRIAGSLYGSDRIIVVAGANKLVKDLEAGLDRVRFVSAHMNNVKYSEASPCTVTGVCSNCKSEKRTCNITAIIHKKPIESDFHVLLIGEELGF